MNLGTGVLGVKGSLVPTRIVKGTSMSRLFEEMAQGTAEARAYMEGKREGYKVTANTPAPLRRAIQLHEESSTPARSSRRRSAEASTLRRDDSA